MNPNQLYEAFIIKANENAQTDNIAVEKAKFAILYNEAAIKFVEWILDKKNSDEIRYLAPVLVPDKITEITGDTTHQSGLLPKDYLDIASVTHAIASAGCCKRVDLELYEIKVENENVIINSEFDKPSIEYREAPYYIQSDKVKILVDNFTIDEISIMYYKYPKLIELNDIEDPESGFKNEDTEMEFDDKTLNRIVSIAVSEFDLNTNNPKAQADKQRVVNKF